MNKFKIPVLCYSRVSGYYNPTANFNKGKKSEFEERKVLKIPGNLVEQNLTYISS